MTTAAALHSKHKQHKACCWHSPMLKQNRSCRALDLSRGSAGQLKVPGPCATTSSVLTRFSYSLQTKQE